MSKPNYRVILSYDADRKLFHARAPELEHCTGEGATRAEAIAKVEEEIDAQLANMLSHGSQPPRSVDEEEYSGELTVKVSKLLHRDLNYQARHDGIDANQLAAEILAAGMESRKGSRSPGARPSGQASEAFGNRNDGQRRGNFGGGQGRGQYHQVMDDRANFIEYVRGLEHQGGAPGRGGPNHGGGHGGGQGGGPGGAGRRGPGGRRGGRGGGRPEGGRPQQFGQRNGGQNGPQANGGQNGGGHAQANPPAQAAPTSAPSSAPESSPSSPPGGGGHGEGEGFGNV